MLKDTLSTYSSPSANDLSVDPNHEVVTLLNFIDRTIPGFRLYYHNSKGSKYENWISDSLVHYFNDKLGEEKEGLYPFQFGKNPSQFSSTKETDIGVVISTKGSRPETFIEFEAKRLSETSSNKEYVCGERGGIERFKKGHHSAHLSICGMFGYVQSCSSAEWIQKVNTWISELSQTNRDLDVDWRSRDESLHEDATFKDKDVEKLKSEHIRKQSNDTILLWHYFLNLC